MQPSQSTQPHQLPFDFTFSQSSLQDFFDCPRRFQLRYMQQMVWPALESEPAEQYERRLQEAKLFHRLVQQHLLGLPAERLAALAAGPSLERWWRNYLSVDLGLNGYAQYTELALSCSVEGHRLTAKYDLVAVRNGNALIYDWKTYTRRPRDEWLAARWQTRVYRALLAHAGAHLDNGQPFAPEHIEMIYWFAEFPSEPARFRYDAAQFERDWSALRELVREISAARNFPLTADRRACRACAYRSFCDRGGKAADWKESEGDSEDSPAFDINFEQVGEIEF